MRTIAVGLMGLALAGCTQDRVTLLVTAEDEGLANALVERIGDERFTATTDATEARGRVIEVVRDGDGAEDWSIEVTGNDATVHAGGALGAQFGLSSAVESLGVRFYHPYKTFVPVELAEAPTAAEAATGPIARRGLHLHTLHPIEALPAMWQPDSEDSLQEGEEIIDWIALQRGNFVQMVAVDDIIRSDDAHEKWVTHATGLAGHAHQRGMQIGVGIQLFGSGNIQQAFDLLDDPGTDEEDIVAINERLSLLDPVPFDHISLSFGEFFAEDPEVFIAKTNLTVAAIHEHWPNATISATIHVGDSLRVEYNGEELEYYFLVKYADPSIIPWVHSVMFYNLYEDAGGAYEHDDFSTHREFLIDELREDRPTGYHPETAYWVAFDDSVPQYFPLYSRSRWVDLDGIARDTAGGRQLDDYAVFSTGWEWGFWQNDVATLRTAYDGPGESWEIEQHTMLDPLGEGVADLVIALGEAQHQGLMLERLTPYIAGRDAVMDFGYIAGIVSQPERPTPEQVVAMTPEERAAWGVVVEKLDTYAATVAELDAQIQAAEMVDSPFSDELRDGFAIDRLRAQFAAKIWRGIRTGADGGDPAADLDAAEAILAEAQTVVDGRVGAMLDPDGARWSRPGWENATVYDFGYLRWGSELCYWHRELIQARNEVQGQSETVPGCAL